VNLSNGDTTLILNGSGGLTNTGTFEATAGNLTGDTFSVTHSGSNSEIEIATDPAFVEVYSLLNGPTASAHSSGVFGASNPSSAQFSLAASLHPHS
jgi:hypothetical protein